MSLDTCCKCLFGSCATLAFLIFAILTAAIIFDEEVGPEIVEDNFAPEIKRFTEVNRIANFGIRTSNSADGVLVETITSVPTIPTSTASSPSVLFKITGSQIDFKMERPYFELCIVLDNSGSMSGNKLHYSKETIKSILKNLAPKDIVHLVTYSDYSKVIFTSISGVAASEQLAIVDSIHTEGSTNMYSGLSEAKSLLQRSRSDNTKRIFLFSDGLVNSGNTNHNEIKRLVESSFTESGITTVTFGLGVDFDEVLMSAIAVAGKGEFSFIDQPERIAALVAHSLQGLTSSVSLNMVLKIEGNNVIGDGRYPIQLGDLRVGETKTQLIDLSMNSATTPKAELLTYTLEYFDQVSKQRKQIQGKVEVGTSQLPQSEIVKDAEVSKQERIYFVINQDKVASKYLYEQKYKAAIAITQNNIDVLNAAPASERDVDWSTQLEREKSLLNNIAYQKDYNTAKKRYSYYGSMSGSSYHRGYS